MVKHVEALDFSPAMIAQLAGAISESGIDNITAKVCDCSNLPYPDGTFTLAFSQFGLMFFPRRQAGFNEMFRVLCPGGRVAVYSWAPVSESPAMRVMLGALHEGFPETRPEPNDDSTIVSGLDDPETFFTEMSRAGFRKICIERISHDFPFHGPRRFWESMARGSAPVTLMKSRTDPAEWKEKTAVAVQWLAANIEAETTRLHSTAFIGTGVRLE
jgi:SAM-dependent methyltransferase